MRGFRVRGSGFRPDSAMKGRGLATKGTKEHKRILRDKDGLKMPSGRQWKP